jgi:hypothetical protein
MLIFGFMGEAGIMAAMPAFVIGMLAWIYMIYVLYMGAGKAAMAGTSASVQTAYNSMLAIIVFGWAIYPIGYVLGYLMVCFFKTIDHVVPDQSLRRPHHQGILRFV